MCVCDNLNWMEKGWMDWIEWMWMWKVESGEWRGSGSHTCVPKIMKIRQYFLELQLKMSGMFFKTHCRGVHTLYLNKVPTFRRSVTLSNLNQFLPQHEMQTRSSHENPVCLSVCPSVCHTRDLWQNGRKIGQDFYTIRKNIYPTFLRRRVVGAGRPLLREILGQPTQVGTKSPIFNQL